MPDMLIITKTNDIPLRLDFPVGAVEITAQTTFETLKWDDAVKSLNLYKSILIPDLFLEAPKTEILQKIPKIWLLL